MNSRLLLKTRDFNLHLAWNSETKLRNALGLQLKFMQKFGKHKLRVGTVYYKAITLLIAAGAPKI